MKRYAGIIDDAAIVYGHAFGRLRHSQRPEEFPEGSRIQTSRIVHYDDHIIETKNSIYLVGRAS